jgi:hypothetical protein
MIPPAKVPGRLKAAIINDKYKVWPNFLSSGFTNYQYIRRATAPGDFVRFESTSDSSLK